MENHKMPGWPHWAVESAGNYSVVSIIHKFVNLKRYDRSFKLTNVSILDTKNYEKYAESIGMFGAASLITGLIFMAIVFALTCIGCCCFSSARQSSSKRNREIDGSSGNACGIVSQMFLFVFIIVGILSHGIGLAGRGMIGDVINSSCGTIDFAYHKIVKLRNITNNIQDSAEILQNKTMKSIQNDLRDTRNSLKNINNADALFHGLSEQIDNFDKLAGEVNKQINNIAEIVDVKVKPSDLDPVIRSIKDANTDCGKANDYTKKAMLGTSIYLAVLTLFFICSVFIGCCRYCASFLGWLQLCILLTLLVFFLPLLVGGGDFCLNAKALIDQEAPENPVVTYYLECPAGQGLGDALEAEQKEKQRHKREVPQIPDLDSGMINILNRIDKYFEIAKQHLTEFDKEIQNVLDDKLKCNKNPAGNVKVLCDNIEKLRVTLGTNNATDPKDKKESLEVKLTIIKDNVQYILREVDCNDITPKFYKSLTDVCTNVYLSIFYYFVNYIISFVAVGVLIVLTCCV